MGNLHQKYNPGCKPNLQHNTSYNVVSVCFNLVYKAKKEQFYFVLILSGQDGRREVNTGTKKKNHPKLKNVTVLLNYTSLQYLQMKVP